MSGENRSWPAGTGVWVVKTVRLATSRETSAKSFCCSSICCRIISNAAKALCPSFMCSTPGVMFNAFNARTPPTPSISSCRMRVRVSPPYSRAVSSRSSGAFPSTSESNSSSVQRPTATRHSLAIRMPVRVSILMVTGLPSGSRANCMGRRLTSVSRYSSC